MDVMSLAMLKKTRLGGSGGGTSGGTDERFKQLVDGTITEISDDTVTSIGLQALSYRTALTSVDLPLVTNIANYAFAGCTSLTSANFPITHTIGQYAFSSCSKLSSISFPLATSIGQNAFNASYALTSVDLPIITSINSSMFSSCYNLKIIDFPLVKNIGYSAFSGCSVLATVILRSETLCALSNTNAFNKTSFASGNAGGTLLVPRALVEEYKTATNWSTYWGYGHNRFLALEDYTVDGTITGEIDWDKLNGGAA
jgi:hypothetical protein